MFVMHGLRKLHARMEEVNRDKVFFHYHVGRINFSVLFAAGSLPYELALTARADNIFLLFELDNSYEVEPIFNRETYNKIAELLRIHGENGNPFKPFSFFLDFDQYIKTVSVGSKPTPQEIISARPDLPEGDRPYFFRWHSHDGNISEDNIAKTRLILGEAAGGFSLRHNMSSQWTDDPQRAKNWRGDNL